MRITRALQRKPQLKVGDQFSQTLQFVILAMQIRRHKISSIQKDIPVAQVGPENGPIRSAAMYTIEPPAQINP
jgi:hypothetical protein